MDTKPQRKHRGPWLANPCENRPSEEIGGGFFVFRRGDGTGRIRPATFPFEHGSLESATQEAMRLAAEQPGYQFDILSVVSSIMETPDVIDTASLEVAA